MSHQDDLSPRERARAACPPGRPRALFTLDELRARRRNSLELDRLCGVEPACPGTPHRGHTDPDAPCDTRYVQPHDGYRPSQLPHNSDYGVSDQGAAMLAAVDPSDLEPPVPGAFLRPEEE